ncbi:MAG: septum formation initiator family protein [Candidatus Eisenbacteria sp.]|nr:septum formation initiator family protein [Candidatus Eisenbacteria bacterium]
MGSSSEGLFLRKIWRSSREQWRRFALAGFVAWTAYSLLLNPGGFVHLLKLRGQTARLENAIRQAAATSDSLDRVLVAMEAGDPFLLERVAREQFGFAHKNERIYLLPHDEEDWRQLDHAEQHGTETFSERRGQRVKIHSRIP